METIEDSLSTGAQPFSQIADVIRVVGTSDFGRSLISMLGDVCNAEHCTVFKITEKSPSEVFAVSRDGSDTAHRQSSLYLAGSFWRYDLPMARAMESAGLNRTTFDRSEIRSIPNRQFRDLIYGNTHIRDRILLCGRSAENLFGISVLRTEASANNYEENENDLFKLRELCGVLISLLSKHISLIDNMGRLSRALTSMAEVEETLNRSTFRLPKRETEVCVRILYGMSTLGIALDLNISEETVVTYRKRAYQRLGIATQRELLVWYIGEWGKVRSEHMSYS